MREAAQKREAQSALEIVEHGCKLALEHYSRKVAEHPALANDILREICKDKEDLENLIRSAGAEFQAVTRHFFDFVSDTSCAPLSSTGTER